MPHALKKPSMQLKCCSAIPYTTLDFDGASFQFQMYPCKVLQCQITYSKIELVGKFMHFVSPALQIISSSAMQKNSAPTGSQGRLTGDAACSEVGATLQGPVLLDCRLHLQRSKEVLHSAAIWFHVTRKHRTNIVPR